MKAIGLDIGTTTVCGVLVDAKTGELLDAKTLTNDSVIESVHTYERTQDADKILVKCKNILEEYLSEQEDIVSIGVTGQMHGKWRGSQSAVYMAGWQRRFSMC